MSHDSSKVIVTFFLACLMLSPLSLVSGLSGWKQTMDTDFSTGTMNGTQIKGTGEPASLELKLNLSSGLMGEWLFEEPSGNAVKDTSGNAKDGTAQNAARTTGRYGKALDYNGASSYVDLPDDLWAVNFTLEAWVLVHDFGSPDPNYSGKGIFFKAQDTGYARDLTLMAVNENNVKGVNFWFGNGATEYVTLYYNGLSANTWYHMAVTRGNGNAIIYINGSQAATKAYSFVPVNHNQDLRLGTSVNPSFQSFDGIIDEARIYDRALSASEIKAQYKTHVNGSYISVPKDLGGKAYFGYLHLNVTTPANTSVQVQLRTAKTRNGLNATSFIGPAGTVGSHYPMDGQRIWAGHNGDGWAQYKAEMTSDWYGITPLLNMISFDYNLAQNVTVVSPNGGENWTGHHNITWTASDPDGDPLVFDLYLSSDGGATYPTIFAAGLASSVRTFDWNTSKFVNGTHYRIKVVARDTSPTIPINVSDASNADFTIFHPGPAPPPKNHPPVVQTPPNGVVYYGDVYNQSITATDQDGDPLSYDFTGPGNISKPLPNMISWGTNPFSVGNYTFAVTVSDGKAKVSVSWKVEVKKRIIIPPPPNSLPKVTLLSPANGTLLTNTSVRLRWNGSDADGDHLDYFVRLDSVKGTTIVREQAGTEYEASGLKLGTTYYWTVVPNDGKGNGTSVSGTWTFRTPAPPTPPPPTCKITGPAEGQKVNGTVLVIGVAGTGGPALVRVEISIDGGAWANASGTSSWQYSLQTKGLSNGTHQLRARSYDAKAYSKEAIVNITVQNDRPVGPVTHTTVEGPACLMLLGVAVVVVIVGTFVSYYTARRRR